MKFAYALTPFLQARLDLTQVWCRVRALLPSESILLSKFISERAEIFSYTFCGGRDDTFVVGEDGFKFFALT
jgi:hypothetical protein